MADSSDPSLTHFAARTVSERLVAVLDGARTVGHDTGAEAVDDLHAATRRLGAALDVFADVLPARKHKRWAKHARRLADALDAVHELDRQIRFVDACRAALAQPGRATGIKRLRLRLVQQRRRAEPQLAKALDRFAGADLAQRAPVQLQQRIVRARLDGCESDASSPAPRDHARASLIPQLDELLAHEPFVAQPHLTEGLHEMRRVARRLGDSLELFAPLYDAQLDSAARDVQRVHAALADLHDTDRFIAMVPEFIDAERRRTREFFGHLRGFAAVERDVRQFREDCIGRRELFYERFTSLWRELRQQGRWDTLRRTLEAEAPGDTDIESPPRGDSADGAAMNQAPRISTGRLTEN